MVQPNLIKEVSIGLANFILQSKRPAIDLDLSVRDCLAAHLTMPIVLKLGKETNKENATKLIINEFHNDPNFAFTIYEKMNVVIESFDNYYKRYGGKAAFFALCLLTSLNATKKKDVIKLKKCLLNWYFEDKEIAFHSLNGGLVAAGWAYDWFNENFNSIAASILANGVTMVAFNDYIKNAILYNVHKIRSLFRPYPKEITICKSESESFDEFTNRIKENGMFEKFLFILCPNEIDIEIMANDCENAAKLLTSSIPSSEMEYFREMMETPVNLDIPKDIKKMKCLIEHKFIRILEFKPNDIRSVFMPSSLN